MKTKIYVLALASLSMLSSCDKWISQAESPSNTLSPQEISRPAMLASISGKTINDGALLANIRTLTGEATAQTVLALGAMTDELSEGSIPNVLLYRQLSSDAITSTSGTANSIWDKLQDLRARSEEILNIESQLKAKGEGSATIYAYARYHANIAAGLAYQYLAESFSTTPATSKGKIRVQGMWLTYDETISTAQKHYQAALATASEGSLKGFSNFDPSLAQRIAASLSIRLYMHQGAYDKAAALLGNSLTSGEALSIIYNSNGSDNPLFTALGSDARDVQISRELESTLQTAAERKALALAHKILDKSKPNVYNVYISSLTRHSALILMDNADIRLAKAELILRGFIQGSALDEVNALIASYDKSSILTSEPTLGDLNRLRRIYLAVRGERIADLRRGLHQDDALSTFAARKNQWIPIPERELRQSN